MLSGGTSTFQVFIVRTMKEQTAMFHPLYECQTGHTTTGYQSNMKCDVYVRKELCAMSCCRVARIIERTTKEQMALFPVTREGHGRERLVSRKMAVCPATWRSSVQRGREGTNLDLEIVFQLLIHTLALRCTICVRL